MSQRYADITTSLSSYPSLMRLRHTESEVEAVATVAL